MEKVRKTDFSFGDFVTFSKDCFRKSEKLGVSQTEVFLLNSRTLEVELKEDQLDQIKQSENMGIGIRVIKDQRQGFAFSSDLRVDALERMLDQATANSRYSDENPALHFPQWIHDYPQLNLYDEEINRHTLDEKIELARDAARYAKSCDGMNGGTIARVERSGYEEGDVEVWIANSNGLLQNQTGSCCGLFCLAVGEKDGEQQSGYGMHSSVSYYDLSAKEAGCMAGSRALQMLGATSVESGVMDLLLDPYVAAQMMGILSSCFSGEAVLKNKSFLAGKLGQQVASSSLTLIDDGLMMGGLGSGIFDGEGTPMQRTVLLQDGVLTNYLYDCVSARKAGTVSTGNGMRSSYKGVPHIGTSNYYLAPGKYSREELIGSVNRGVYVTEIMGAHTANPVSGDFSFGASGILVENGQLTRPVRGITIAGNFQQLLQKINGVGRDLTFFGSKGAPTVRIEDISVSGR